MKLTSFKTKPKQEQNHPETPEAAPEQPVITEAMSDSEIVNVYGHDLQHPTHGNFARELKRLKKFDPDLYDKIVNLK